MPLWLTATPFFIYIIFVGYIIVRRVVTRKAHRWFPEKPDE